MCMKMYRNFNKKTLWNILVFLLMNNSLLIGQSHSPKPEYDDKKCLVKDIEASKVSIIKRSSKSFFEKYHDLASMKDMNSNGFVTRNSVLKFKDLFEEEAKVTNDMTYNTYKIPFEDYSSMAFDYLTNTGIKFSIDKAELTKLYEKDGYYYGEIEFLKKVYFSIDNQLKVNNCKKGRVFKETLLLRWTIYDVVTPRIDAINGGLISECSDSNPAWIWGIEAGVVLPNIEGSDLLGNQLDLKANSGLTGVIMAAYYKSLGTNGKTWLKLGVSGGIIQTSFSILPSSYTQTNTSDVFGAANANKYSSFDRIVTIKREVLEKQSGLIVSIPIGLRQQLWAAKENKFNFGVEIGATVSGILGLQKSWFGQLDYKGVYHFSDGTQSVIPAPNADIQTEAYGLKSNVFFDESDKSNDSPGTLATIPGHHKLSFNPLIEANIMPYFNVKLSEKSFVQVGFTGSYGFTNFFKSNNSERFIFSGEPQVDGSVQDRIDQGLNTSLVEDLTKSYKAVRVGLQISLFKFIK